MSYAICNVVVGAVIDRDGPLGEWIDDFGASADSLGCEELYSSSGPNALVCGELIYEFSDDVRVADLVTKLIPTPEQVQEAREALAEARTKLQGMLSSGVYDEVSQEELDEMLGCLPLEPDVWIVWSSS